MREPAFWWRKRGGSLLAPLAAIYGAVAWGRIQAQGKPAGVPVICLGNLTVGGAGKTPAALAVTPLLLAVHERPFFLSRGYGGKLAGPVRVDPSFHHSADVGDEVLPDAAVVGQARLGEPHIAVRLLAPASARHISGPYIRVRPVAVTAASRLRRARGSPPQCRTRPDRTRRRALGQSTSPCRRIPPSGRSGRLPEPAGS